MYMFSLNLLELVTAFPHHGKGLGELDFAICPWLYDLFIGRTLAKFNQLKRNKRFDNFIYVGMGSRIYISICCQVTSCTGSTGSQESSYKGQIQNLP